MNERELRDALRAIPEDSAARERAWRVVRGAYEPRPRRRRPLGVILVAALLPVAIAGAAAAREWVFDPPGEKRARPALVRVPGGGTLLVQSGGSQWVVSADGARRRLGSFTGAAWSPRGLYVVAWRGHELAALEPGGAVRWSLSAPAGVTQASWAPVDGFRIAYVAGTALRIVDGDGTGDRRYGTAGDVAPAWRPRAAHVLAYVDRRERVNVAAVDTRRRLWRTRPVEGVSRLAWSADGRRLLVVADGRLVVVSGGRLRPLPGSESVEHVAWAPRGSELAVVRSRPRGSQVVLLRGPRERVLFTAPGRLDGLAWSPDGSRLLVPWSEADQWLFLRPHGGRLVAVANIARQLAPGARAPAFPRSVAWCCPEP
jgi:sugar lactone lactonase YvrE